MLDSSSLKYGTWYYKEDSVPESTTNILLGFELYMTSGFHVGLRRDPPENFNWDSAKQQVITDINALYDSASNQQVGKLSIAQLPQHPQIYYDSGEEMDWTYDFGPPLELDE